MALFKSVIFSPDGDFGKKVVSSDAGNLTQIWTENWAESWVDSCEQEIGWKIRFVLLRLF